jgi:hypothetical protein
LGGADAESFAYTPRSPAEQIEKIPNAVCGERRSERWEIERSAIRSFEKKRIYKHFRRQDPS